MSHPSFQHLPVLVLESRRATEMATLVTTYGGRPHSAPALREVPIESNAEALACVDRLVLGEFDVAVFLTGVGLRALLAVVDALRSRDAFVAALARVRIVARGPKPVAVLRDLRLTPWVTAPEPNTWREVLAAIDGQGSSVLRGLRVAVQEYGTSPAPLIEGLRARGASVLQVPVYRYALPDDLAPLEAAVGALIGGAIGVALFTTATQVTHLFQVAARMGREDDLRAHLRTVAIGSIGPTTSDELREHGVAVDFEASHPKMGFLVREAAEQGPALSRSKRGPDQTRA